MSTGPQSVSDEDLGRVMGICRFLNLFFTEEQMLAIIGVIEAGANPAALVEWLKKVDEAKTEEITISVSRKER
ncbi:hypothetical protein GCK32_002446 [Trichostrongylus colubriformis]|uniref:Uncharacterized protein n=1 Tax=Trichostrongylus colubriformis TaxID=6319 RepID=A0AAN8FSN9_TRICO